MAEQLAHPPVAPAAAGSSSHAGSPSWSAREDRSSTVADITLFGDADPRVRMRMQLIAAASATPELALAHIVALLVEGEAARSAIIEAISNNEPLREQWQRAWEQLRS